MTARGRCDSGLCLSTNRSPATFGRIASSAIPAISPAVRNGCRTWFRGSLAPSCAMPKSPGPPGRIGRNQPLGSSARVPCRWCSPPARRPMQPQPNCSTRQWNAHRATSCRWRSRRGATACAPVTISPRTPRTNAKWCCGWHQGLPAMRPVIRYPLSCCQLLTRWPMISIRPRHTPRRVLAIDGGARRGWGRLGWIHCYRDEAADTIECFQIARVLGPADPLGFLWSIGIAAANFERCRFTDAIHWYRRALAEEPKATWLNRFMAPALLFGGKRDAARQSLCALSFDLPELTIRYVGTGVPHTARFVDQTAEGLRQLGMPLA